MEKADNIADFLERKAGKMKILELPLTVQCHGVENDVILDMGFVHKGRHDKTIQGMAPNALAVLQSILGIGSIWAAGLIAEIGSIHASHFSDALAKYAGLTWGRNDSGDFEAEDTPVTKAGNAYLYYYFGKAANSVRRHLPEYQAYFAKKYAEVPKHQRKRALTSRKLVRPVFGLLVKNQLYTGEQLDAKLNTEPN